MLPFFHRLQAEAQATNGAAETGSMSGGGLASTGTGMASQQRMRGLSARLGVSELSLLAIP